MSADIAYAKLNAIRPELEIGLAQARSEQDARFKIINRFLTEILGWSYEAIKTEPHVDSGFIDYLLIDEGGRALCVIEAKKIGELAIGTASNALTTVNVGGQVLKPTSEAIDQATRYSANTGATYAVVTDGERWVFFRSIRADGLPPSTGKAFVFPSLTAVLEEFATFYELLSPDALRNQLHFARLNNLEGGHIRASEPRYFIDAPENAHLLERTQISRDMVDLFKRFFAAMASKDDNEMRKACFVETQESIEAETVLRKITNHLTNSISSIDLSYGTALQSQIQSVIKSKISETCLIVGASGSGKSTFVERFFEDVLPDSLKSDCVIATIKVSDYPGGDVTVSQWLAEQIRDIYEAALFKGDGPTYDDYMGMFFKTYKRWSTATYSDLYKTDKNSFKIKFGEHVEERRESRPHDYAIGLLTHTVFGRKRLPCIIFDNIDGFSPTTQNEIIQYASALKNSSACFILISASDKSVWRLSKTTNIHSYFSRTFFLPTPPAKEILSRRVGYIRRKLEGDEHASYEYFSSRGLKIAIKNLGAFATVIEETLINHPNISDLLSRLANHDIAEMLRISESIISSPSLKVDDLVQSYFTPKGMAPFDEKRVVRSMILGDYDRHRSMTNSSIINLFATEGNYPFSPLLACSILQVLLSIQLSNPSNIDATHMTVAALLSFFEPCGVARDETRRAAKQLFEAKMVSPLDASAERMSDSSSIAISPKGIAHLELATRDETYLSEMARVTGFRFSLTRSNIESEVRKTHPDLANTLYAKYILSEDAAKLRVPNAEGYSVLTKMRNEFAAFWKTGNLRA